MDQMDQSAQRDPRDTTGVFSRDEIREQVRLALLHADIVAQLRRIERQRRHWYWRAWWRLRYLPYEALGMLLEVRAWLMQHTALGGE